jgi:hypothetical protein
MITRKRTIIVHWSIIHYSERNSTIVLAKMRRIVTTRNPSYEGEPDAAETDEGGSCEWETDEGKSDEHSPDEYRSDT